MHLTLCEENFLMFQLRFEWIQVAHHHLDEKKLLKIVREFADCNLMILQHSQFFKLDAIFLSRIMSSSYMI